MTEVEWLACTEPKPMLDFLRGRASERKLRLFACGCVRQLWCWFRRVALILGMHRRAEPGVFPSFEEARSAARVGDRLLSGMRGVGVRLRPPPTYGEPGIR